ncbi:glutamate ABC transporter substrate-binding protein [Kribbella italica]|uniref:Polar amino acid transport system substrate-binding protein n=1 Tax=Kribbella italica TaxID=1540520 RepID=A0A7W9J9V3_9ACTN|nr:glutamate ABC transporter substrate-binding protein [Kribbella italica]MBB5837999.1 polar amino acid transport system substrate-binding protein [Kribbella italica]
MKKQLIAAGSVLTLLALTACGSGDYAATQIPTKPAAPTSTAAPPAGPTCTNNLRDELRSYAPAGALPQPGEIRPGSKMDEIKRRDRLRAGISADSLNLGSRNPISGAIEGFDIDMVREVARAIFGDPNKVELVVISSPQRIPVLQNKNSDIDIVARNMTINCARWQQIAFSAEYYRSGQKTLVQRDSPAKSLADLRGKTVCAPAGSTSLDNLNKYKDRGVKAITADTDTGCLVLFQQGKADGITGDDTVLAGEAAQDPYARIIQDERISDEPYGLGMARGDKEFVQFVNGVLAEMKASGRWKASYDKWLAPTLGPAPTPPVALYGRG